MQEVTQAGESQRTNEKFLPVFLQFSLFSLLGVQSARLLERGSRHETAQAAKMARDLYARAFCIHNILGNEKLF